MVASCLKYSLSTLSTLILKMSNTVIAMNSPSMVTISDSATTIETNNTTIIIKNTVPVTPRKKPLVAQVPAEPIDSSDMIRLTPSNSKGYIGRIIQYTSRGITKYAIIKRVSYTGKTIYIQEITTDPLYLFKEVDTDDLGCNLEIVSRCVYLKH
jgi:hypothetical protein